jgi:hypothetical protein
MPAWQDEWLEVILRTRSYTFGPDTIAQKALGELHNLYAALIEELVFTGTDRPMTPTRRRQLRNAILEQLRRLRDDAVGDLAGRVDATINQTVGLHQEAFERAAFTVDGATANARWGDIPDQTIRNLFVRRGLAGQTLTRSFKSLRGWDLGPVATELDRFLARSIALGVDANTTARQYANIIARNDPLVLAALRRRGRDGQRARGILKSVEPNEAARAMKEARDILWRTRMIARSEINNGNTEAHRMSMLGSPVVALVKWRLSGRHAGLPSSPDVCDVVAFRDIHGLGPGIYHIGTCPPQLHPNCGCRRQAILRPPSEWNEPKLQPGAARIVTDTEFRAVLGRKGERMGARALRNQTRILNNYLQRSFQLYDDSQARVLQV